MEAPDRPELEPVTRRTGIGRLALAVILAGASIGVAVWKPWARPDDADRPAAGIVPSGSDGTMSASHAPAEPAAAGTAVPPVTAMPPRPAQVAAPTVAGLDLSVMGTTDLHTAWGVAVAYVSRTQFANALVRGASTVTPVVSWQLIPPDHTGPAPPLDHPGVTSVAIAATWPPEVQPVAVRLVSFGALGTGPASSAPPKARPPARVDIPLGDPLARTLSVVPSRPLAAGPFVGAFYFPVRGSPVAMNGWPGHGWPPATYAFEVELQGGRQITLPFTIGAAIGPG